MEGGKVFLPLAAGGFGKLLGEDDAVLSGQKLSIDPLPLAVIGPAVWIDHHFTLTSRDLEELLLERGIAVNRTSIRS